ncbi:MAG: proprotein convertase P-domain-containing protein [Saprospiraceae bacterium]
MKKRNITLWGLTFLGCLFGAQAFAQLTVNHPTSGNAGTFSLAPPTVCTINYYDNGGPTGNYATSISNSVVSFAPGTAGYKVRCTFSSFATEGGFDFLTVYDGPTTGSPFIASTSGGVPPTNMPGNIVQATAANASGSLTFSFFSDVIIAAAGWAAVVTEIDASGAACAMTAPANQSVSTDAATCDATVSTALPTFSPGGCAAAYQLQYSINGGTPVVVPQPFPATITVPGVPKGTNVILWQLVNPCGGTVVSSASQSVTVADLTPPVITCPGNLAFNLGPGECCSVVSWNVTSSDNCPGVGPDMLLQQNVPFTNFWSGYFTDMQNLNPNFGMTVSNVNVQASLAGAGAGIYNIKVYMKLGTSVGFEANVGAWTLAGEANVNITAGFPTVLLYDIPTDFQIPAGQVAGLAVVANNGASTLVRVVANSLFANSSTSDANLLVNQAPGRWMNGNFAGVIFAGENPKPQLRVTYNLDIPIAPVLLSGPASGDELCKDQSPYTSTYIATDAAGNTSTCSFTITLAEYPNPVQTLVCNDFVYVSLDADCTEELNADQILEGGPYGCYDDYIVQLDKTPPYGNGPWVPAVLGPQDIGKTYAVQVIDPDTGNKCWGNLKVEDKLAPALVCTNAEIGCNGDPNPALPSVPVTFSPSADFSIADVVTTNVNIPVPPGATVDDLNVTFQTNHTWVGDISATLTSPSGTTIQLFDRPGGGGCLGDGLDVVFDDAATNTAAQFVATCGNLPAIAGTYQPANPLSTFNGEPTGGTWVLAVTDFVNGDAGPVSFAQLNFAATTQSTGFPNGLTIGVNVFQTGPNTYNVLAGTGDPVLENCSDVTLSYQDSEVSQNCASGLTKKVNRKWTAVDAAGNTKTCVQVIDFFRPSLSDVTFPPDYDGVDNDALPCGTAYPTPDLIEASGNQGYPYVFGNPDGCSIGWTYTDVKITVCDGTYKILRTWTIVDWCAGTSVEHKQIIKIVDEEGPTLSCPANLTVSTDPFTCCATIDLPDVIISDNCSRINNISGMVIGIDPSNNDTIGMFPIGGNLTNFPGNNLWEPDTLGAFGLSPCLPQGTHTVIYQAEDDCGNTTTCTFRITVRDYIPPVAACDEHTIVSIGLDDPFDCYEPADGCDGAGVTWVKAKTFDDGSYDNCNNIKFTIQRMADANGSYSDCILGLNSINGHPDCDDFFPDFPSEFERAVSEGDSIKFYCCEVGTSQMVILRVYQLDAFGNLTIGPDGSPVQNSCMVEVEVQDKIKPVCITPGNVTVSCEAFDPSLWAYGKPSVYDNCCLDTSKVYQGQCGLEHSVNYNLFDTLCNKGTITRTFRVYDCHGQSNQCTQRIVVNYEQDYFVKFPNDVIVTVCDGTGMYGEPTFFGKDCELLGVSFEDEVFTVVPDACLKIERTWKIINWCTYNPNAGCVTVPNPNPNATSNSPQNLPGPIVSACGTPAPWNPTVISIAPGQAPTNYCTFYDANANCYVYKQIIKIIDTQKPTVDNCPASPVEYCDVSVNDPLLWNQSYWWDAVVGQHDLCEGDAPLTITATDACSGANVNISYLLFLDLDGDGTMETVVSSNNPPAPGQVNYNNVGTPSYSGGTPRVFDGRPVLPNEIYRWANHQSVSGTSRTASVQWKTFPQMPTPTNQFGSPGIAPQLPYGTHKIKWTITDGCGNETYCEYTFVVKDCKAPTVVCLNGLSVNIMPTQMVQLWATDFLQYAEDNCTPPTPYTPSPNQLKFAIRKAGQGTGFPVDALGNPITSVTFTCAELGMQEVELWAQDLAGNADFCQTFVDVQDNNNNCNNDNVTVAGALKTEAGDGVEDANVNLQAGTVNLFDMSDDQGAYIFNNSVPNNSNYTVTPTKDDNPLNGVSTYDLVLISKHILGLEPLNSPYKMIAADANKSNSITTFDIVEIRKLILGIYNELPNNTSWRFVDKGFVFPQPSNPFATTFPETKSVAGVTVDQLADDFYGVKVGDVNGSAIANALMSADDRSVSTLLFDVQDRAVKAGEVFEVAFKGTEKVQGYQFTMNFAGLEVVDVVPGAGMRADNFGVFADAITTSVDNESNEFSVKFRAAKSGNLSELLTVSSRITRAEAYSQSNGLMDVAFRFNGQGGAVISGVGFELYQNQPNPFVNKTLIGFHLPEATEATLTIFDETGRMLFTQKGQYGKGYNAVAIDRALLNTTGVMYYKLETATDAATRKMIQTK